MESTRSSFSGSARSSTLNGQGTFDDDVERQAERELQPTEQEKRDDKFLVDFGPDDPENPKNWSKAWRWYLTAFSGLLVLNATFASSAPSGVVVPMSEQFDFSDEVATLTISVFVAGYCVGPIFWGPLSEQYGRRPMFIISFVVYTAFQLGCALAPNTAAILIFRLLGGIFAACPLTNSGGVISDLWDAGTRGNALAIFTVAPFAGPALGPLVGGYIATAGASWRWLFWTLTIFAGVCLVLMVFTLSETYEPIILVRKARRLRKETGDERYHAPLEKMEKLPLGRRLNEILGRPFKILVQEPMLVAVTAYMSFVYGCIYLLFEAYPIVFSEGHGFSAGASGLMFLPLFIGAVLGVFAYIFYFNVKYEETAARLAPAPVPPEDRLWPAITAAPLFAIGFFWFGWTSFPSISFWAPMLAGSLLGYSIVHIFLALFNYIIDAYLFVAASALAANTIVRSVAGATFPLFARQMFDALNPRWASTLLGCVAILMLPIPLILKRVGHVLRARSKHAPTPALRSKDSFEGQESNEVSTN